ncbi:ribonuclease H-like domain-containing protein [Parachaetomium inaequale]|uniref:Ribonuclease H-like domain-containing protein n=1 Tax=Parachaetomium inaequale TaxID=2588326 RepID=A0AAN6SWF3_9PEZI|nr:ribonuclease H-like domain-containing protein [Parachaetomium inaequale]
MDIDRFNFWQTLPGVLEAISLSEYVAFDLEMTGISGHSADKALQHTESTAYHHAAEAARTFQILQIGLTCLSYDCKQKGYRARTFTFHLTPEFVPPNTALAKLIDRKLVFSYRSFLFLKENNFSFEKTFAQGIPYLSRPEGALANKLYLSNSRHRNAAGAETRPGLYNDTRNAILTWIQTNPQLGDSILITSPHGPSHHLLPKHIQVIRQVVRTEFSNCFAVFRDNNTFAEVVRWDQGARQLWDGEYKRRHDSNTNPGFRYVIEALVGGSFAGDIDPELLVDARIQGANRKSITTQTRLNLQLFEDRIKQRRPILIGHNPFLDLCFLHETFLQPLPADAAAFRRETNQFFPRIVDTKYLSAQLGFRTSKNLEQLYRLVVGQGPSLPIIPETGFDARGGSAHGAGFDSWMTAAVFLGLSAKMAPRDTGGFRGVRQNGGEGKGVDAPGSSARGDDLFRELCPFAGSARASTGSRSGGIESKCDGEELIPQRDCEVWRRYGNKLRLGAAGVMDLARRES